MKLEELGLLCICLWKVWSLRNVAVHDPNSIREVDIVEWARCFINEIHSVNPVIAIPAKAFPHSIPIWKPPDPGMYKINSDVVLDMVGHMVGLGVVIRNSDGLVMSSSSQKITTTFFPQVAEAVAISRGLQLAIDSGLTPCMLESDAEVVVKWINNVVPLCSEIGNVISDILVL